MNDKMDELKSDNTWEVLGSTLGLVLGEKMIETVVSTAISVDNYVLFSLTKVKFQTEERTIGYGVLGNVNIFDEVSDLLDDSVNKNLPKIPKSSIILKNKSKKRVPWEKELDDFNRDLRTVERLFFEGHDGFTLRFVFDKKYPIYLYPNIESPKFKEAVDIQDYFVFPIERNNFYLVTSLDNKPIGYVGKKKINFDDVKERSRFMHLLKVYKY